MLLELDTRSVDPFLDDALQVVAAVPGVGDTTSLLLALLHEPAHRFPSPSSMSTVTVPALRRTNEITATSLAHSQTGEKTRSTFVPVIGLRSSFSRSVTAKAAAVAPSRARTISVWGHLEPRRALQGLEAAHEHEWLRELEAGLVPWNSAAARIARSLRGCGYSRRSVS